MWALGFYCLLIAAGLFIYQSVVWLHNGVWPDIRVYDPLFSIFGPKALAQSWLYAPGSWFGVHKIVKWFIEQQLASVLLIIGGISMTLSEAWHEGPP
jgi:hypothetical protein